MNSAINNGLDCLDQYYNDPQNLVQFSSCIDLLRQGLKLGLEWCSTLRTILTNEPLTAFEINTEFIGNLESGFSGLDELLDGKEYTIGPESEGKTIKPLNILEAKHYDVFEEFKEFYWSSTDPNTYTFGGIFPNGLYAHLIDQISPDAVTYHGPGGQDSKYWEHWDELAKDWQKRIDIGSVDPDAHHSFLKHPHPAMGSRS